MGRSSFMPQRDDRVSRRFGKLPDRLWETLGKNPGRACEEVLTKFFEARKRGETFPPFPASPDSGKPRTVWLEPEISKELDAVADATRSNFTSVLLAAFRYQLGDEAIQPDPDDQSGPPRRQGPRRKTIRTADHHAYL